ncbi:FMN reductase [Lichenicola cladoniae]|uniref:FMN reductase n=1 Tax=Lichenicola cladoniae TaxID=1484109 RepID=A0A6M8HV40_9PROT|nr:flavin reductase [Lichenicola cladoniae]NPD66252.1 FMN reductase [Acetobacteraceae bacterium]QKE92106.1 FMN reductase [Lichenicola cladoniae]
MGVDTTIYREAMSRLGAAVNVITTGDGVSRHGLTASAVCSVTDDPPTLLVCINRSSRSRAAFIEGGPICVNTLAHAQRDISVAFAGKLDMEERFTEGVWTTLVTGAPVLEQSLVSFDCLVSSVVEVGTHSVIFCHVQDIRLGDPAAALVYFARAYHGLSHV